MPVHEVKKGNQICHQWGDSGKVYCGKDSKKKAAIQGWIISKKSGKAAEFINELTEDEFYDVFSSLSTEEQIELSLIKNKHQQREMAKQREFAE